MTTTDLRYYNDAQSYPEPQYGPPAVLPGSSRRHLATVGPLGYAVERQDQAQPLRSYVPDSTRERAASIVLWCRVALAIGGTAIGFTALTVLFLGLWRLGGWVSG